MRDGRHRHSGFKAESTRGNHSLVIPSKARNLRGRTRHDVIADLIQTPQHRCIGGCSKTFGVAGESFQAERLHQRDRCTSGCDDANSQDVSHGFV